MIFTYKQLLKMFPRNISFKKLSNSTKSRRISKNLLIRVELAKSLKIIGMVVLQHKYSFDTI